MYGHFLFVANPSSYKNPNYINEAVCIFGKMWIYLDCLHRPSSWSVAIRVDSVLIPSGSLAFISFSIITGAVVGVACLDMCIIAPEFAIASMLVLVGLGGLSI